MPFIYIFKKLEIFGLIRGTRTTKGIHRYAFSLFLQKMANEGTKVPKDQTFIKTHRFIAANGLRVLVIGLYFNSKMEMGIYNWPPIKLMKSCLLCGSNLNR